MFNRPYIATALLAAAALLPTAPGRAAEVTVTDAKIGGGKLVVTGTTAAPNTWVRLDGQTARDFNVKSGADAQFAFSLVYHPGDCIVDLQRLISPTALGATTAALVADCGPAGVSPRGAWTPTTAYAANDLVTYLGSTWRARRGNANALPVLGAVWEQFAAGEAAPAGNEVVDAGGPPSPAAAPDGAAGGDLAGTYPNPTIRAGAVTTTKLGLGAVTGARIAAGTINYTNIAPGTIRGGLIAPDAINGSKILDGAITTADLAISSVIGSRIAASAVTTSDVANRSLTMDDIDLADRSGSIAVGAIANGRCATISGSVPGALPGDVAILTTNGSLPNGMLVYAQRALTDTIHIKVCNLTGATSAAITDLPVRILSIH